MARRHKRLALAGMIVLGAAAVATSMAILMSPGSAGSSGAPMGSGMPSALAGHLAKLKQAAPGNGGMANDGPGGAADAAFAAEAYPDSVISLAEAAGARAAFAASKGRPFPRGKGKKGQWVSVGPSKALYPFEDVFRNVYGYVPNAYVAGGRTTSIALASKCKPGNCVAYITPAGGGVWKTKNILAGRPHWEYLGGPLGINAAGAVTIDENDPTGNTVYVGTGEANICGSGCVAGVGLYKSTNGGETWTGPLGGSATDTGNPLAGKGIGEILIKPGSPNTIYAATTTALRGMSEVCCSGVTRPVPGAAQWGLYKSTNGGATWNFIHNGGTNPAACNTANQAAQFQNLVPDCSPRGVRNVAFDPSNSEILYASSFARGVWRSSDGGASWVQIKPSINAAVIQSRPNIAVTRLPNGDTRMYVLEGNNGTNTARLYRSDSVRTGAPVFTDLTSPSEAAPGFAWHAMCDPQCWYDSFVYTPKGHPDIVYAGGDYAYGEHVANKRGVVLSTDAGVSGTDMTMDGTDALHPNGLHPDQHDIVTNPNNPFQFFETNDGGVMRSSGEFVNRSSWCSDPNRGLNAVQKARCEQMLSRIPSRLDGVNDGLATLQWIKVTASPHNPQLLQGGTQDNGTWETDGNPVKWENTIVGDGGWNGFDVALPNFRFHSYFDTSPEVSFDGGEFENWIWVADPLFGQFDGNANEFYSPIISDPVVSGTMFAGTTRGIYRTKTHGLGTMDMAEAQRRCNSWFGAFDAPCGDWVRTGTDQLDSATFGADRLGGAMSAVERTTADTTTAWSATTRGRVFITKNVTAEPASAVAWTRLDDDSPLTPGRFVSSIDVDPANGNRAWVSYNGYGANTPGQPGHVFEVVYNPATGTSTWTDLSHNFGDLPVNDLVRDDVTGDLYAATDFGVLRLAAGTTTWTNAAPGLPNVEVTSLEIVTDERILYAATHGLSTWRLNID